MLGFDPRGPLPKFEEFLLRVHPEDQHLVKEQYEKSIRHKSDFEMDYRLVHPPQGLETSTWWVARFSADRPSWLSTWAP